MVYVFSSEGCYIDPQESHLSPSEAVHSARKSQATAVRSARVKEFDGIENETEGGPNEETTESLLECNRLQEERAALLRELKDSEKQWRNIEVIVERFCFPAVDHTCELGVKRVHIIPMELFV